MNPSFRHAGGADPVLGRHQIRVFYASQPFAGFTVHGLGVREWMPAVVVDRLHGTGDHLLMAFHHEVRIAVRGTIENVSPGSLVVWSPGRAQHYGSPSHPWLHSWIHCAGKALTEAIRTTGVPLDEPITPFDPALFEHGLLDLYRELSGEGEPDEETAVDIVRILLRRAARSHKPARAAVPEPYLAVKRYLDESFPEPVTLAGLARRIPCSAAHFSAEFKRHFGIAPIEYVIKLRLHCARMLLFDRAQSIGAVARAVGYDDENQLSRLFRRHYGSSPRALRKA
jgi:AraC family transcriptional regulator, arabinose operon regulatory protein